MDPCPGPQPARTAKKTCPPPPQPRRNRGLPLGFRARSQGPERPNKTGIDFPYVEKLPLPKAPKVWGSHPLVSSPGLVPPPKPSGFGGSHPETPRFDLGGSNPQPPVIRISLVPMATQVFSPGFAGPSPGTPGKPPQTLRWFFRGLRPWANPDEPYLLGDFFVSCLSSLAASRPGNQA